MKLPGCTRPVQTHPAGICILCRGEMASGCKSRRAVGTSIGIGHKCNACLAAADIRTADGLNLVVEYAPVVESAKTRPLCLRIDDRGQVLEISKLLFRQSRLLSNPDDVVGVKRLYHPGQCLHSVRRPECQTAQNEQHGKRVNQMSLGGDRHGAAMREQ